ncbi:MAG: hypothetical protein WCD37_08490 [Chloroflexia bacterium]
MNARSVANWAKALEPVKNSLASGVLRTNQWNWIVQQVNTHEMFQSASKSPLEKAIQRKVKRWFILLFVVGGLVSAFLATLYFYILFNLLLNTSVLDAWLINTNQQPISSIKVMGYMIYDFDGAVGKVSIFLGVFVAASILINEQLRTKYKKWLTQKAKLWITTSLLLDLIDSWDFPQQKARGWQRLKLRT